MNKKTDFYRQVELYAKTGLDEIASLLWAARKKALLEVRVNKQLVAGINGALRVRFNQIDAVSTSADGGRR